MITTRIISFKYKNNQRTNLRAREQSKIIIKFNDWIYLSPITEFDKIPNATTLGGGRSRPRPAFVIASINIIAIS